MTFQRICSLDELWEGEMAAFEVDGDQVLLLWPDGGDVKAYQGMCPHQDIPLEEGRFDGKVLMCRAHSWTFDGKSGAGINPGHCRLAEYPVKVEGDAILVDTAGVTPNFATAAEKEEAS